MGKRVIWTGDLNISREEIDTAAADESMRKNGVTAIEWISNPARRMFNQLLVGGKVHGERDEGRETQIMWDICRGFHEDRRGMYTCWETKVNARPGNYGARIDYVICTHDMKDWFSDSNIQEGLMGSDHCPVYAVIKDTVVLDGQEQQILDLMSPSGMFENGVRKQDWSTKNLLPLSGKLIQEFDKRRSIKDMFTRQPSLPKSKSTVEESDEGGSIMPPPSASLAPAIDTASVSPSRAEDKASLSRTTSNTSIKHTIPKPVNGKRPASTVNAPPGKKSKTTAQSGANGIGKGQQSLKGFFAAKTPLVEKTKVETTAEEALPLLDGTADTLDSITSALSSPAKSMVSLEDEASTFAAKHSWGKLFAKPIAPKCEHNEPCKTMVTKKPGANCGRSFWMCNRPLGPSGKQERGTQWRCNTFIWASDWDTHTPDPP